MNACLLALLALLAAPREEEPVPPSFLAIDRGPDNAVLYVPRDEELVFRVRLGWTVLEASVGKVTMRSTVVPWRPSVLEGGGEGVAPAEAGAGDDAEPETARLSIHAEGEYAWYEMDALIETRILPQDWPRFSYRYTHKGTENRRREMLLGQRDGEWQASARKDTKKNAPPGTRIWKDPKTRTIPPQCLDLLSAVYLSRTLVMHDLGEMHFPLVDDLTLWAMRIQRGGEKRMELEAGTFDVVEVVLEPRPMKGEDVDEEDKERFEGLFGLRGSIHLWVEKHTGVPVRIQGELPVGFLDLAIDIELVRYAGTPPAFRALPEPPR